MKRFLFSASILSMAFPAIASADALSDAKAANICNVVSAEYADSGRLEVVCREGTVNPAYDNTVSQAVTPGLAGGLSAGATAGIVGGIIVIGVIANSNQSTTTTTGSGS